MDHYPFATQDWSLIRHRTLAVQAGQVRAIQSLKGELWVTVEGRCNDFFVKPGESINVPCNEGRIVIESLSSTALVRVAVSAQSPLVAHVGPTFAEAIAASVLRPAANALCAGARTMQRAARWLDPKVARA